MVGPVLHLELLLGSRRGRQQIFRRVLTGWLVLQFLFFFFIYLLKSGILGRRMFGDVPLNAAAAGEFAGTLFEWLVIQQLFLVLLATPALTAGAITDEKSTGTLQYLFTADLTPWEIILGKFLGRIAQVGLLALCGLPMICFLGVFCGVDLLLLAGLCVITFLPVVALGGVSLLASVWSKQTRDAVIGVYCFGILGYVFLASAGGLEYFNPLYAVEPAWKGGGLPEILRRLPLLLLTWGTIGGVCLALATWRLRGAYLRQLQGEGRQKQARWWRAQRAAVGEEPIRWKERHVEGIAPLSSLRRVPGWLGMTLIAATTTISSLLILWLNVSSRFTWEAFAGWIRALDFFEIWEAFRGGSGAFFVMANLALLIATLIVGIRCSGAVTSERERQTWEPLLLSPLPVRQLIRAKLWGIIGASYPYLLAYAVPAFFLSVFTGLPTLLTVVLLLGATWLAMLFVGAAGLWCSVRSRSSWRSLLGTMLMVYFGGFVLYAMALPFIGIMYLLILLTLVIIDVYAQTGAARGFMAGAPAFILGSYIVLLGAFYFLTWYLIRDAEKYVADRERIRHWKDEPMPLPRRRPVLRRVARP